MGCAKGFLIFFNCIFWILGAGLMGVAVWFLLDSTINDKLAVLEYNSPDRLTSYALYLMIATGGFMFLVGFFGCCGALREDRVCLGLYITFVLFAFLAQIGALILVALHRSKVKDGAQNVWLGAYNNNYDPLGARPYNLFTQAMNGIQYDLKCCGVRSAEDYKGIGTYLKNTTAPATCCVQAPTASRSEPRPMYWDQCTKDLASYMDSGSIIKPTQLYWRGCYQPTMDWLQMYSWIVIGVCAGVAFLEIFVILLAACLCRTIRYK